MGRNPVIDESDVARAATRLIGQGKRPTIDAVYEEVGRRGSKTTIHKLLRSFLDDFGKRGMLALPSSIPEPLVPIIEDFWSQALVKAGERYDSERVTIENKHQEELALVKRELGAQIATTKKRDALLTDREQHIAALTRDLDELQSRLRTKEGLLVSHEATIVELKRDKGRLSDQLDEERQIAARRYDQAQEDWARERAILERSLSDIREQLKADNEKNERLADHWMLQLDDARQQVRELKERQSAEKERWTGDMRLEKARADRLAVTVSKMESEAEQNESKIQALEDELADVASKLKHLRDNPPSVETGNH